MAEGQCLSALWGLTVCHVTVVAFRLAFLHALLCLDLDDRTLSYNGERVYVHVDSPELCCVVVRTIERL